MKESTITTRN